MKSKLGFVLLLTSARLAACTTVDRTVNLRLGMSRDEAIKVMGSPDSVSARAGEEYLNYFVPEPVSGNAARPYCVRIVNGIVDAYGYAGQIDRLLPPTASPAAGVVPFGTTAERDGVKILSLEPSALVPDRSQTVTIVVRYSLANLAQADLDLSFNDRTATT